MRVKSSHKKSPSPAKEGPELVDLNIGKGPNIILATSKRPASSKIKIKSKFTVGYPQFS